MNNKNVLLKFSNVLVNELRNLYFFNSFFNSNFDF